jgi:uncharacterized protein YcbK (DUF882 family)
MRLMSPALMALPAEVGADRIELDRRAFLRNAGICTLALVPIGTACAGAMEWRSLSFVHTHTGESLSAVYFKDGSYQQTALERFNHLLRDFRTGDVHPIAPAVLDILVELQVLANRSGPYEVISAYRSPQTNSGLRNRSSGVAEHSLHMEGRAIDVRLAGFSTRKLQELALQMGRGGVGFYPKSDFVHLDNGRVRSW